VRKFGWRGPVVRYPGDPSVLIEVEEANPWIVVTSIRELDPAGRVAALPDDPLDGQMPVAGEALLIEPQVRGTPPNSLPELRRLIHHVLGYQIAEGVPVPVLRRRPVGCHHLVCTVHDRNLRTAVVAVYLLDAR